MNEIENQKLIVFPSLYDVIFAGDLNKGSILFRICQVCVFCALF